MEHSKKAYELFMAGYNCSQSVFAAFCDVTGVDEDTALRLSSSFGGGIGINPYVRVLGFNNKGKELISEMMSLNPKLNVVTSVKKYIDNVANKNLKEMLEKDILATNIYTLGYYSDSYSNLDYTNKIEIL